MALPKHGENGRTLVAMVDSNDQLRVKSYVITDQGGDITPLDTAVDTQHIQIATDVVIELVDDGSNNDYYVTATRDDEDKLHLTSWKLDAIGNINQIDHKRLGSVSEMVIAAPWRKAGNVFVVTVRDAENKLRLIAWEIIAGQLFRRDTFVTGGRMFPPQALGKTEIRDIAVVTTLEGSLTSPIGSAIITTAFKDEDSDLRLYSWFVTHTGNISFSNMKEAGEIQDIAAFRIPDGVVTAVRDSDKKLRLISWTVSNTGRIKRRATQTTAWNLTEVAGAMVISPNVVNIALRVSDELWVTSWMVEGWPDYKFGLIDIDNRGDATNIDLARIHHGVSLVTLQSGFNNLLLTAYKTSEL